MAQEQIVISREAAAASGLKTFYTGEPCKHGHVARRYITNAGCLECAAKWKRLGAKNAQSHDLVPHLGVSLWRSRRLTPEQLKGLDPYLQQCIDSYCAHHLPVVCKTCDGSHYVPIGDGGQWMQCPDCPCDVPTT